MEKKYRLNTDTGVLHIIGNCYQTKVKIAHSKDYDTEEEARLEFGEKVHCCLPCQRKENNMKEVSK